jgi:predicted adenylyl cyclase CyaB
MGVVAANIEIKARVRDWDALRARAETLSETPCLEIRQRDVFFYTPKGRLKLRMLAPNTGQLVYYERPDQAGPKQSDYILSATSDPATLEEALTAALGIRGVVSKVRYLYLVGSTRIHLDQVEGLGCFLELEVVLGPDQSAEEGEAVAVDLMSRLGVDEADLIDVAYVDLLERGA